MATNTPLQSVLLTSSTSTITFSNIDQNYTDLVLVISAKVDSGFDIWVRCNGDSASNYSFTVLTGNGTTASSERNGNVDAGLLTDWYGTPTNTFAGHLSIFTLNNYSNTTTYKTSMARSGRAGIGLDFVLSTWRNTAAITSLTLRASNASRTFDAGTTVDLYGIKSGAPKAFGGDTVTTDGNYWYHTFKTSGTFTPQYPISCDVLVVAGGGGGGQSAGDYNSDGGGGSGGLCHQTGRSLTTTDYTVTIGAGGSVKSPGANSVFDTITALGGGNGQTAQAAAGTINGGSGGGAAWNRNPAGTATQGNSGGATGYGNAGGAWVSGNFGGGGGGAGAVGTDGNNSPGNGGAGRSYDISGSSLYYAGGGGGGRYSGAPAATGGSSVGGTGSTGSTNATAGAINTGSGGGGSSGNGVGTAAAGGSGIVILRYAV